MGGVREVSLPVMVSLLMTEAARIQAKRKAQQKHQQKTGKLTSVPRSLPQGGVRETNLVAMIGKLVGGIENLNDLEVDKDDTTPTSESSCT